MDLKRPQPKPIPAPEDNSKKIKIKESSPPQKTVQSSDEAIENFKCPFCNQIIYQCVTLYPCNHSVCLKP